MTVFGLICAFIGFGVLVILAVQVLVWCAQRLWRWGKRRHASWVGWLRTTAEYLGLVEAEGTVSRCGSCMTVIYWGRDAHEPPEWTCPLCARNDPESSACRPANIAGEGGRCLTCHRAPGWCDMADPMAADLEALIPSQILNAGRDPEQLAVVTFLARYSNPKTRANYTQDLRDYMRFCREQHVGMLEVERGHLELYIRQLEDRGLAQATVSRKFSTVFTFLDFAEIDDRIVKNPARKVRRPKIDRDAQRRTWFSIGEIHSIITKAKTNVELHENWLAYVTRPESRCMQRRRDEARQRVARARQDFAVLQVMATVGIRVGALCGLDVASLHVSSGTASLRYVRKGDKTTSTSLPTDTLLIVMKHLDGRVDGPLFRNDYGNRITRAGVARIINRLAASVGITHVVTPHGMRRTFATTARRLGASQSEVQQALNHADPRTTSLYEMDKDSGGGTARHMVADLLSA